MSFEVLAVGIAIILAVATLDIVEDVLMAAEEFGRVRLEKFHKPSYLGTAEEQGVLAEEFTRVIEGLQLGECLKIAYAQLGHVGHGLRCRLYLQQFVELLHLAPGIDAVVIENGSHLYVRIIEVVPIYFGVFFFFFFGEADFLGAATFSSFLKLPEGAWTAD